VKWLPKDIISRRSAAFPSNNYPVAMTESLLALVFELQTVEPLQHFSLAGGTNLAIRFNHRKSVDIDLFTDRIIGGAGWENIDQALRQKHGGAVPMHTAKPRKVTQARCTKVQ
jgi:Nucleotidyl transferase AbiEii toxin, Type IV TA system